MGSCPDQSSEKKNHQLKKNWFPTWPLKLVRELSRQRVPSIAHKFEKCPNFQMLIMKRYSVLPNMQNTEFRSRGQNTRSFRQKKRLMYINDFNPKQLTERLHTIRVRVSSGLNFFLLRLFTLNCKLLYDSFHMIFSTEFFSSNTKYRKQILKFLWNTWKYNFSELWNVFSWVPIWNCFQCLLFHGTIYIFSFEANAKRTVIIFKIQPCTKFLST